MDVRTSHLRASEKTWLSDLPAREEGASPSRRYLEAALDASGRAVEALFARLVATGEQVHKRGPVMLLAYFVSHESHHRGSVVLALKQNGFSLSEELRWGLWAKWFKD